MATPESEAFVHTFARGLKVIEAMGEARGRLNIADIAMLAGVPRTAVRRFLLTLVELGFVHSDGKLYWLTPKVLRLGMAYVYTLPFWRQAQLVMEELRDAVSQSCAISVLDEEEIVYVARVHARRILSMSPAMGSRLPAHAVSMGRVLLSGLDESALDDYLVRAKLRAMTHATIVDPVELGARIRRARDQGYAWVDRELDDSICGVAVPIRNADGSMAASINISLPAGAYTEASACEEFLVPLRQAAARIRSTVG